MKTSLYYTRPFATRYAIWSNNGRYTADLLRAHRTARASWLYINRQQGIDDVGPTPDWSQRNDLVAAGRVGPSRASDPVLDGIALWVQADGHARASRPDEPACAHAVGSLPIGKSRAEWRHLMEGFCEDHLTAQGMVADWAIHHRAAGEGTCEILPHAHLVITTRAFDRASPDYGRIRQNWLRTDNARKAIAERWWAHTGLYPSGYALTA